MESCNFSEQLEAFAAGQLGAEEAATLSAHVKTCDECRRELEWLKVEQNLMVERATRTEVSDDLWRRVEEKLTTVSPMPLRARRWAAMPFALGTAAVAAAVLMVLFVGPPPVLRPSPFEGREQRPRPAATDDAAQVLTDAEHAYEQAAATLEKRYASEKNHLRPDDARRVDDALQRTRAQVAEARALAPHDPEARLALLDGYADYVHSLQSLVGNLEVTK
jgi:hypothetical protein